MSRNFKKYLLSNDLAKFMNAGVATRPEIQKFMYVFSKIFIINKISYQMEIYKRTKTSKSHQ